MSASQGERPGNEIVLRCESDGRELEVATLRSINQWATVFLSIAGFCPGQARLVARVADKDFYIGVGTPYEISSALYYAQTQFGPRALVVILSWALILAIWASCSCLATRMRHAADPFAAGFVGVGAFGMAVFAAYTVSLPLGQGVALGLAAGAILYLGTSLWRDPACLHFLATYRSAFLLWLGVALTYTAFVSAADSGGGSWAINGFFSPLRWSSDNQLPFLLAEGLLDGTPLDRILFGQWYATDRTPLLSALLLLPRSLLIGPLARLFGSTFIPVGYMMAGITILSSLGRRCRLALPPALDQACLDRLGADDDEPLPIVQHGLHLAKDTGCELRRRCLRIAVQPGRPRSQKQSTDIVVVALCAVLAYLAHASNAFALVPLAIYFAGSIRRVGLAPIAAAGLAAVLIYLPWAYWQIVVQPGGNALLRYALAGDYGFDKRQIPVLASAVDMYSSLGVQGWLAAKLQAFELLVSMGAQWRQNGEIALFSPGTAPSATERVLDFFIVARTFGIAALGLAFRIVVEERPRGRTSGAKVSTQRHRDRYFRDSADDARNVPGPDRPSTCLWIVVSLANCRRLRDRGRLAKTCVGAGDDGRGLCCRRLDCGTAIYRRSPRRLGHLSECCSELG